LLVGYVNSEPLFEQFTEGQLEHCVAQCRALHDYLQTIMMCVQHRRARLGV